MPANQTKLLRALKHIIARSLLTTPVINRDYEVPYLAGYSKDGRFIYIDKRLPKFLTLKNGDVIDVDRYLKIHETEEKFWEDIHGHKYQYAHQLATKKERAAVKNDGIDWNEYQSFMEKMIKKLKDISGPIPPDLDLKPERDYHDYKLLHRLQKMQKRPRDNAKN